MSLITYLLLLVLCTFLTPAFGCDNHVAGYSKFSGSHDNSTIIGIVFANDNDVYTSRCFSINRTCEDQRLLYSHNSTLADLDIYYDGCTIFITDISGDVYTMDMIGAYPETVKPLVTQLSVAELSVDWLSPLLYVFTQTRQLHKCDMMLRNCLHLHDEYLTYTPSSIVADAFNGYLYWITDSGSLVKHDLAEELSGSVQNSDIAIKSNVSTYSVVYDQYDLYSIYNYGINYSEITLTYLNGQNGKTHIALEHTAGDIYTELNCLHDTHCLWLETNNYSTQLNWKLQESRQPLSIHNLNFSAKSLFRLWSRQAQPLPVPTTYPDFNKYYSDSSGMRIHWDRPDIVGHYLLSQHVLAQWTGLSSGDSKYMQSEAAWSAWNYELNITSDEYSQSFTNLTALSLYIGGLQPSTNYSVSVLAYTETDRGPARTVTCKTLSSDPLIYTSSRSHLRVLDAFGDLKQTWDVSGFSWIMCDMVMRDENLLYVIASPRVSAAGCIDRSSTSLVLLDISAGKISMLEQVLAVSAVGYDWIGKMVYLASSDTQALSRADAYKKPLASNLVKLSSLNLVIKHLSIDSINGRIYWTPTRDNNLYSFDMGSADSYTISSELYDGQPYTRLNGPVVDMTSGKVHWVMTSLLSTDLYSRDLADGTHSIARSSIDMSGQPFMVSDEKFYVILNGSLKTLDLNLKIHYNTLDTGVIAFLYYSPSLYPRLEGMDNFTDTVEYVVPEIDPKSISIIGVFDNFTLKWNLISPDPLPSVQVYYNVRVEEYYFPRLLYYNSSDLEEETTPYFTDIEPETLLLITVEPYTKWRTGQRHRVQRDSPSTFPGVLEDIRMLIRRNLTNASLLIKWSPPLFTGGIIINYDIKLSSEMGEEIFIRNETSSSIVVDVRDNTLYNVSIRAQTSAGFGNWSAGHLYNTSTPSPLPVIYALPYTPETIEVKWKSSPLLNDTLYTYRVKYYSDFDDLAFVDVEISNPLYRLVDLKPDTMYQISMMVCCLSDDKSLWFAGEDCERTSRVKVWTFQQPSQLEVVAVSTQVISLRWFSPSKKQVHSFHIKYWHNNTASYKESAILRVEPSSQYTVSLSSLHADTEYNIAMVLEYRYLPDYTLPPVSVRTNKTAPAPISVTSAQCNIDKCWITTTGSLEDKVTVRISCGDGFTPLTFEIKYKLQRFNRSQLPDDISTCSVVAWSSNSVGKGPESLQVHFTVETDESSSNDDLVIGLSVTGVVLVSGLIAFFYIRRRRRKRKKSSSKVRYNAHTGMVSMASTDTNDQLNRLSSPFFTLTENSVYEGEGVLHFRESVVEEKAFLKPYDRSKLTLTKFLGSGAFGEVYAGKAKDIITIDTTTLVAVKTLRVDASQSYKEEFVKEAKLMCQFDSENIVRLLGSCIDKDPYYIVIELMNEGDLVAFLRKARPTRAKAGTLNLRKLVSICIDVAAGCKYLEMLHFVHRDLAARNCLVNLPSEESEYQVKLGDFGLARDIYRNDYYRKEGEALLPVRWMSPEALVDGVFTTQSDIWAFGVLMWEAFTLAMQPYPARSNIEVLKYVTNSGTLDRPSRCPEILFELMGSCWSYNAADRPTFLSIYQKLTKFLEEDMTEEVIAEFDNFNRRLTSENEFFASSTSSGPDVNNAAIESPVFEPEQSPEKELRADQPEMPDAHEDTLQTTSASDRHGSFVRSIKRFLQRKASSHRHLDRVQSVPADSGRRINKYVRSDSTISADRCKTIKTYTEPDGRQVSFEESSLTNHGEPAMSSIREERSFNSPLRVDISNVSSAANSTLQPSSLKTVDLETSSATASAGQNLPDSTNTVQYTSIAFGDSPAVPEATVQYSTMAFPCHGETSSVSESSLAATDMVTSVPSVGTRGSDSVQYSTMSIPRHEETSSVVEHSLDSTDMVTSVPSIDTRGADSVQYSAMAFPHHGETSSDSESSLDSTDMVTSVPSVGTRGADSVQYSTMAFPPHEETSSVSESSLDAIDKVTSVPSTDTKEADSVQYSTINFDKPVNNEIDDNHISGDSSTEIKHSTMLPTLTKDSKSVEKPDDQLLLAALPDHQPQAAVKLDQQPLALFMSDQTINTGKRCDLAESTPFGAKVNYSSDRFQYHPPIRRQKRVIDPRRFDMSSNIFTQTL